MADASAGQHIKLAVICRLARDQKRLIGSMFVSPGGPREGGVDLVRNAESGDGISAWGGGRFNLAG